MAFPTAVNSQITDSVTQTNVEVLASSPATASGLLLQTMAASLGLAFQNAVSNQQNMNNISSAVTTRCVETLLGKEN